MSLLAFALIRNMTETKSKLTKEESKILLNYIIDLENRRFNVTRDTVAVKTKLNAMSAGN